MTPLAPPPHCVIAVDGPTYERRQGPFWEAQDVLSHLCLIQSGAVVFRCEDEDAEDAVTIRLTAAGFARGVDYAVWYAFPWPDDSIVNCPSIRFEVDRSYRDPPLIFGSPDWDPGPEPAERVRRRQEFGKYLLRKARDIRGTDRKKRMREMYFRLIEGDPPARKDEPS